jgi:hypothetical protein
MGDDEHDDRHGRKGDGNERRGPATVVSGTRVTVAFPFSKITSPEPSDSLRDLASLVADLAEALVGIEQNDVTDDLRRRASVLRDELQAGTAKRR